MDNQTVVAAPSAAEAVDVFNGQTPSLEEYNQFRTTGELPDRFKPAEPVADPAPAEVPQDSSEGDEPESGSDSETEQKQQEKGAKPKRQTAEERIAQLEATIEKIKRNAGLERKAEVAPATEQPKDQPKAPPQNYAEWRKAFKPSEWIQEYGKQNPEASYEDATAAMADFLGDIRDQYKSIEQQREAQAKELNAKVNDARQRYGAKFDDILQPTLTAILSDQRVDSTVKELIDSSEVVADVLFTLGSDDKTLNEFLAMPKAKQLRYIAAIENGIIDELGKAKEEPARKENGQFAPKEPPAKPKTQAPKPPSPVTGVASGAFDVSDESLSPEDWMRKRNADLARRG